MSDRLPLEALVVDDEAEIRELLVEFLRSKGLPVASACDGRAAVTALQREPSRYNFVITDLALPGVDGLGVLRAAREANPSCQVVIVTGYASLDSAIQAVRLGAYDYLTKPFSLGQIDVILARLRYRLNLEAENRQLLHRLELEIHLRVILVGAAQFIRNCFHASLHQHLHHHRSARAGQP